MSDVESSASKAAKEILNKPFVKLIKGKFQGQSKNIDRKLDFVWFDCGGSKEYGEFLEEYLHMCSGYIAMHYTYYRGEPNPNYEVIDRYCSVYNFERVHLIEPHKYRQGSFCLLRRV